MWFDPDRDWTCTEKAGVAIFLIVMIYLSAVSDGLVPFVGCEYPFPLCNQIPAR